MLKVTCFCILLKRKVDRQMSPVLVFNEYICIINKNQMSSFAVWDCFESQNYPFHWSQKTFNLTHFELASKILLCVFYRFKVGDTIFVPKPDPNANTWKGKLALVLLSPSRWKVFIQYSYIFVYSCVNENIILEKGIGDSNISSKIHSVSYTRGKLFTLQDVLLSPGVCNSEIGTFPKKFVVNTADHSEEEIKAIQLHRHMPIYILLLLGSNKACHFSINWKTNNKVKEPLS